MADDLFQQIDPNEPVIDPEKDYTPELVGEGKKYKDQQALARAVMEKEAFIERIKKENAEFRSMVASQQKMEDLVQKLQELQQPPSNDENPPQNEPGSNEVDIDKRVEELISQREAKTKAQQNLDTVMKTLRDTIGPNYPTYLNEQMESLGMTREEMNSLAMRSPTAFLKLVNSQPRSTLPTTLPPSQVNTAGLRPGNTEKNQSYYKELRRKDPALWMTPKIQNEMHSQAIKLGEAFFA